MNIPIDPPDISGVLQNGCPRWLIMWVLAVVVYAGFKWITWRNAIRGGVPASGFRSIAFLFLWPGMDPRLFLNSDLHPEKPSWRSWLGAAANAALGALLLWGVARLAGRGLLAGWVGMIGFIFLLHFGVFRLLAHFWQQCGICAQPLMRMPVAAKSLGEFWGKRWNVAFRDVSFGLFFRGFRQNFGLRAATMLTFIASGLIHDLVISVPAGGGYGLPTAYFTLQGAGLLLEHSHLGACAGLRGGWRGRLFAWTIVAAPVFILFPSPFILRVIIPFMCATGALPGGPL